MFEGMGVVGESDHWRTSVRATLERNLPRGVIVGAVIDRSSEPGLCAAGLLQIQESLGSPRFPRGEEGHISSVSTDQAWRRQGLAQRVVAFLVDEARTLDLERVELHASIDGESIYRKLGFRDRPGGVELRLEL